MYYEDERYSGTSVFERKRYFLKNIDFYIGLSTYVYMCIVKKSTFIFIKIVFILRTKI